MTVAGSLRGLVDRVAAAGALDRVGKPLSAWVAKTVGHGAAKDALSGTWLGHPLHPLLTDLPIGSWTSAFVLDLVGGARGEEAADRLVGLGILAALPTAAAGLSDWSDTVGEDRRLGTAHALANSSALALYCLSWLSRRRGHRRYGRLFGYAGAGAATVGGYLGGHLVYRKGIGPDRNAWKHGSDDWAQVADPLGDDPVVVTVGDDDVLVVCRGGDLFAISSTCGHAGGPLNEGTFDDAGSGTGPGGGCVTCPWHGSTFRLADGGVVHGPATGPQPHYDVRSEGGTLLLRRSRTGA